MRLTAAIPTFDRPAIVVDTVRRLLALDPPPDAIVVVDQTPAKNEALAALHDQGLISVLRLDVPSIPHAMNEALLAATTPLVLFLDDDVEPSAHLVAAHRDAHENDAVWAVVGQILQPGEEPAHVAQPPDDLDFRFFAADGRSVRNVMAGNLSVKRERAIAAGGFDENYVFAAYRFETDFALRLAAAGGTIWFEPRASLRHLKLSTGGLRAFGDHRTSAGPAHSAGDYYFALRHRPFWRYAARRLAKNVATRYHLAHPWHIPSKLIGEVRGMLLARRLAGQGPKLLSRPAE
jgi:GT2 family glycosyltransferase